MIFLNFFYFNVITKGNISFFQKVIAHNFWQFLYSIILCMQTEGFIDIQIKMKHLRCIFPLFEQNLCAYLTTVARCTIEKLLNLDECKFFFRQLSIKKIISILSGRI